MNASKAKTGLIFILAVSIGQLVSSAIMDADVRREKLDTIHALISNEIKPVESELISVAQHPFIPGRGIVEEAPVREVVVMSEDELLAALSEYINPTGIFMFGGEFYLVFKESKLKVGSEIRLTFNGEQYVVIISEITGSSYAIKRGDAELQMKFK